jgi:outer membrane protein
VSSESRPSGAPGGARDERTGIEQSLTAALAEAYQTNPQLLAQRALLRATDEQVPQALAQLAADGHVHRRDRLAGATQPQAPMPTIYAHSKTSTLDLMVNQQLYSGGRTEAQTWMAISNVEASRAQTLAVETTVFQAVAQAYLDVVRDQLLVEVNRNNEMVLRKEYEATLERFHSAS